MQEKFNKDLEEIKSQSIMNNAITEIKNTLEGTNSRITELLHYSLYIDSFLFLLGPC